MNLHRGSMRLRVIVTTILLMSVLGLLLIYNNSFAPIPTPLSSPSIGTTADPRMEEFQKLYGIKLLNRNCAAPCSSAVEGQLTLKEFIEKVGVPERVIATVAFHEPRGDLIVLLFYIRQGFSLTARREIDGKSEITPDMTVLEITLWNARTFPEMVREMERELPSAEALGQSQEWAGFGPVKVVTGK